MVDEARLRTRVVRYLRDQNGEERTVEEIATGTDLTAEEVKRGIDHNHFVDSLQPNLYYGVIAKVQKGDVCLYRYNRAQYLQNRTRWIDASGRRRGGRGELLPPLPRPKDMFGWFRRGKK